MEWEDGSTSFFPCDLLRRMSPSADSKAMREEIRENPLAILPSTSSSAIAIDDAELVGNYAIRFTFSDGHHAECASSCVFLHVHSGHGGRRWRDDGSSAVFHSPVFDFGRRTRDLEWGNGQS